jgi:hypothetical protein
VKNRFQSLPFKCNLQRYPEVLAFPEERVLDVAGRLKAGGKTGAWVDANPSLLLKLLQSDAAFYYVLEMPAEVTRWGSAG